MASLLAKVQAQRQDTSGYLHTLLQASLTGLELERPASAVAAEPRQVLPAALVPLSSRELEVLRLLATGASNQEIAAHLVITLETVKRHVRHILAKLAVMNRTQAVVRARDFQLL